MDINISERRGSEWIGIVSGLQGTERVPGFVQVGYLVAQDAFIYKIESEYFTDGALARQYMVELSERLHIPIWERSWEAEILGTLPAA